MSTLIARADGNLTTAATWGTVDATSLLDSEAANTALTTSYVESATFTPGAITIDGIAVKIKSRSATPSTNTFSVRLAQAGSLVTGTEITVNVSDIATATADQAGWFFVKFAAPVTLAAATAYTLSAKASATSMVTIYRNATAGNWSRMLRTTTTAAPAAGDNFFILGEWTAAATKTNRVVTMNSTATTDYGAASSTLACIGIGHGGTVTFGSSAATDYILRVSGLLVVWAGGTLNIGTVATPIPSGSSAELQFDCGVTVEYGLWVYGTLVMQGVPRTAGKPVFGCLLTATAAVAATTLNVDTDTGWKSGDDIYIAPTTTNGTLGELRTLSADAGASSLTISAGLTNAHLGTAPLVAEVALLTRNVRMVATNSSFFTFLYAGDAATVDLDWVAFRYLGSGVTSKFGITVQTVTGSFAASYCVVRDQPASGGYGFNINGVNWNNVALDHCVVAAVTASSAAVGVNWNTTAGSNWSISDVWVFGNTGTNVTGFNISSTRGAVANLRACGYGGGTGFNVNTTETPPIWSGFVAHSCSLGLSFSSSGFNNIALGQWSGIRCWHNSTAGIWLASGYPSSLTLQGDYVVGNGLGGFNGNIYFAVTPFVGLTLRDFVLAGTTTHATARGIKFNQSNSVYRIRCENMTFGVAAGALVAHTVGDIDPNGSPMNLDLTLVSCVLASTTPIANSTNPTGDSVIRYQRAEQVAGAHRTHWLNKGIVSRENGVYKTAAPSEKLAPAGALATFKLTSGPKRAAILSGNTVGISVWIRKDSSYAGNAARLVQKANAAIGVSTDVVLATHSGAADTWQQLTATSAAATDDGVAEFEIDCDGSAGAVYVDDWQATTNG